MLLRLLFSLSFVLVAVQAAWGQTIISGNITQNRTLSADTVYTLRGFVYVKNGATLTIEPGTVILGEKATKATLIVTRGSYINANGTADRPIIFTSASPEGLRNTGDWGGVVLLGRAPVNCSGGTCTIEGGLNNDDGDGLYGGTIADDSSGVLRYVRIDYAGIPLQPDNEINSLTMAGVGSRTIIEYIMVTFPGDDAFEWFGGNVNAKYLISVAAIDDDFDSDQGWSGAVQYGISLRYPTYDDVSLSNGFESDNSRNGFTTPPRTSGIFSNMTFVGPNQPGATPTDLFNAGAHIRRASELKVINSVIMNWPIGLLMEGTGVDSAAFAGDLIFANNVVAACDTPFKQRVSGTARINFTQWLDNNNNEVVADATTLLYNDPYNLQRPDFTLKSGSPLLTGAAFDLVPTQHAGFFNEVTFRGAMGTNNWASGNWVNWNPQTTTSLAKGIQLAGTQVYPNPVTDVLHIRIATEQRAPIAVQVMGLTGQILLQTQLPAGVRETTLRTAELPAGVYVVRLQTENGEVHTQRIVR